MRRRDLGMQGIRLARGLAFLAALGVSSCGSEERPREAADVVRVYVSIAPQAYFVKRVGGERVSVGVLVGPGQSHHTYEPTPKQVRELSEAQVFFRIGVPFEKGLMEKLAGSLKSLRIVDTAEGVRLREMTDACEEAGHVHGKDPHIWLDPKLVKVQARHIRDGLAAVDAGHRGEYDANLKAFEADLDALDARLARVLAPLKGREFFVFHPAYGYFGDAYGLTQVAVEEDGKEPGIKRIQELIGRAKKAGVRLIFVQPQFPTAGARTLAESIGGAVVPLDPMSADYMANMESMASAVARALSADAGVGHGG